MISALTRPYVPGTILSSHETYSCRRAGARRRVGDRRRAAGRTELAAGRAVHGRAWRATGRADRAVPDRRNADLRRLLVVVSHVGDGDDHRQGKEALVQLHRV